MKHLGDSFKLFLFPNKHYFNRPPAFPAGISPGGDLSPLVLTAIWAGASDIDFCVPARDLFELLFGQHGVTLFRGCEFLFEGVQFFRCFHGEILPSKFASIAYIRSKAISVTSVQVSEPSLSLFSYHPPCAIWDGFE